jgi:Domain of unknown function (DUF4390)
MKPIHRMKTVVLALVILMAANTAVFGKNAELSNIIVTNTSDDLLAYMRVEGAFPQEINEALVSGVPVTFAFYISLLRVRGWWMDKKIAEMKATHTIKYDTLKKAYIVQRSWENDEPKVIQSFEEAQRLMTEVDSLKIISLQELAKGSLYQLRAKAELSKVTLPFYLHYVLFFVSLWDFKTDWYTIDFIY